MTTMKVFKIIRNHKSKGRSIREIHKKTGIARQTIAKYYHMSAEDYQNYRKQAYARDHVFAKYKDEIIEVYAQNGKDVYVSSVYDLLENTATISGQIKND